MPTSQRLEAIVHGLVQGVFFRYNTQIEAVRLGVVGTVRNLPDGTVQVVAEGPRENLQSFLGWLERGPELAHVHRVDVVWKDATGGASGFQILR